jgi:hypothetical protein
MATEFCQKCKQSHPGRLCDYDDKGECAETVETPGMVERKRSDVMPGEKKEVSGGPRKVTRIVEPRHGQCVLVVYT